MLDTKYDIVVDNINTSALRRRVFIDQARILGYHCVAVLIPMELQVAIDRQDTRTDKTLDSSIVRKQYMNTQMPQLGEFDEIIVRTSNL